jgi:hypothetical protein
LFFQQHQAEETDTSISELARVVGGERALIEECGGLLSKTHKSQVCLAHDPSIVTLENGRIPVIYRKLVYLQQSILIWKALYFSGGRV